MGLVHGRETGLLKPSIIHIYSAGFIFFFLLSIYACFLWESNSDTGMSKDIPFLRTVC